MFNRLSSRALIQNSFRSIPLGRSFALGACLLLAGCSKARMPLLNPNGYVGESVYDLLIISVSIMALIVVPVITGTLWIAWRYRAAIKHDDYDPEFDNSPTLHFVTLFVPLLTIFTLGTLTWIYTHRLDPYRPLGSTQKPFEIQAVSLDHKWLFIYPSENIATTNDLVAPVGRPVTIRLTSDPMMTAIFIPGLLNQIYAMPGMETRANFLAVRPGQFEGSNVMYSGPGFEKGRFTVRLVTNDEFTKWVAGAKTGTPQTLSGPAAAMNKEAKFEETLDPPRFAELVKPTAGYPTVYFKKIAPDLFVSAVRKYMPTYQINPLPTASEFRQSELAPSGGSQHKGH